mgnify:CR=1 FL=1
MSEKEQVKEKEEIHERKNLIWILKNTLTAVKKEDVVRLKELSNHTVHSASVQQDPDSVAVAVIVYALSKIIERKKYTDYKEWPKLYKSYIANIKKAIADLEQDNSKKFREDIKNIQESINQLSGRFKKYIQDVFRKAEINKASRVYEHGISMEQTAKLLGITIWELAEYAGQTGISDVNLTVTMSIKNRLKQAEEIFEK